MSTWTDGNRSNRSWGLRGNCALEESFRFAHITTQSSYTQCLWYAGFKAHTQSPFGQLSPFRRTSACTWCPHGRKDLFTIVLRHNSFWSIVGPSLPRTLDLGGDGDVELLWSVVSDDSFGPLRPFLSWLHFVGRRFCCRVKVEQKGRESRAKAELFAQFMWLWFHWQDVRSGREQFMVTW